jgi:phage gpG-like protein
MAHPMGDTFVTRVGVLGANNARDDGSMGNAEIGLVHEFGSKSGAIPARSFLKSPLLMRSKMILNAMGSSSVKTAFAKGDYERVYKLLGIKAEEIVQDAFSSGGFGAWSPLKPATIARKGSSSILQDTNELRRSITSDVVKKSEV